VWLGFYLKSFRDRRAAIAALEKAPASFSLRLDGPAWLRERARDQKYFWNPVAVRFHPNSVTDGELRSLMKYIHRFEDLTYLYFTECPITDQGLKELLPLADKLDTLDIRRTGITDQGIATIKQLPRLTLLRIEGSAISPQGITELKRSLPNCKLDVEPAQ
jgi:hypothetical protein